VALILLLIGVKAEQDHNSVLFRVDLRGIGGFPPLDRYAMACSYGFIAT